MGRKKQKKKGLGFFRWLVVLICMGCAAGIIVYSGAWDALLQYYENHQQQEQLGSLYHSQASGSSSSGGGGSEAAAPGIRSEFQELYEINPEVIGWLDLADGGLSVPVLKRDNAYYLTHDFYGEENRYGSVFIDYRNSIAPNDANIVIYGHNMGDGSMFGLLTKYREPSYLQKHPLITFNTLHQDAQYVIFSVFLASTLPEHGPVFDYHNRIGFSSGEEKQNYINEVGKRSLITTPVEVTTQDEMITLSTCSYDFDGERLVVVTRKLRDGETAAGFSGLSVTKNPNAVMPEIWNQLYGKK